MASTVKNKIRAGTIFLFGLLLLSGGLGIFYVVQLKKDSKQILRNNYESLDYGHRMLRLIDSLPINRVSSIGSLQHELQKQENNVTEPGEQEATTTLRKNLASLVAGDSSQRVIGSMRYQIDRILAVNMRAIESKNQRAGTTADNALTYLSLIAAVIFVVAISFAYNFPSVVTGPIQKLTDAIQQIGAKNYRHRIHLNGKDEFSQMAEAYNRMAERLEYFENSNLNTILFQKNRAEAVINSLKDAGIGIDGNGIILFANNRALELLGLATENIVGKSTDEIAKQNDLFKFLMEDDRKSPFKVVVDNHENYFNKEVIEVKQEDGAGSRVILLKNITSFKELDEAKTNFIATVSHELKTPLASSDFGLKLLEDPRIGQLSAEQQELVKHLKDDNQRMLKILSELLNMSQVETGKMEVKLEKLSVPDIIERSLGSVKVSAEEKNIHIDTEVPATMPAVQADVEKVTWVLINLLTNAIKFSPAGDHVHIRVTEKNNLVQFVVSDNGPGIDQQFVPKVFDRYFKVPGNTSPGTGLGLAISKEFVEAMNGKIWVDTERGKGSRFGFELAATASK